MDIGINYNVVDRARFELARFSIQYSYRPFEDYL